MARNPGCRRPASVIALLVLLCSPVTCLYREDTYPSLSEDLTQCCEEKDVELKRFDDLDYDSFVSLMGRRSAAQSRGPRPDPGTRKGHTDHILADMFWGRTRKTDGGRQRLPWR